MTIKDHARNGLTLMQYIPVNLSGVIFSFENWMRVSCELKMTQEERHNHPITQAYLIGIESMLINKSDYSKTLDDLENLITSKNVSGL